MRKSREVDSINAYSARIFLGPTSLAHQNLVISILLLLSGFKKSASSRVNLVWNFDEESNVACFPRSNSQNIHNFSNHPSHIMRIFLVIPIILISMKKSSRHSHFEVKGRHWFQHRSFDESQVITHRTVSELDFRTWW